MSHFIEHAEQIFAAAKTATLRGEACTEMTILIGKDGGIQLLADSDWPLDPLAVHHGARAAYRVCQRNGEIRVEGREGDRSCLLRGAAWPEPVRPRVRPSAEPLTWKSLLPPPACYG